MVCEHTEASGENKYIVRIGDVKFHHGNYEPFLEYIKKCEKESDLRYKLEHDKEMFGFTKNTYRVIKRKQLN